MNQTISSDFFQQLGKQWQTLLLTTVSFAIVGFFISTLITPQYESTVQLLVVQKYGGEKIDAFSAARGAEYLSNILVRVVGTNAFMDESMKDSGIVDDLPKNDPEERLKSWNKKVIAKKINNASIVEITTRDASRKEANDLAKTIANAFVTNGGKYHGGGDDVEIRLIDGPVTLTRSTIPDVPLNTLFAACVGLIVGAGIIFLRLVKHSQETIESFSQNTAYEVAPVSYRGEIVKEDLTNLLKSV